VRTELGAIAAAAEYEAEITANVVGDPLPTFDLILLGMGDDGHIASLFPGTPALEARERLVVSQFVPKLNAQRITFTASLINAADTVFFLVSGSGKAERLQQVLLGDYRPHELPAQLIAPAQGKLFWMVDAAAAAQVAAKASYPAQDFIYRRT
jgi:6-phosphogluconolactonase